ncbi:MAG TPA: O-methyltransferase [Steroidobacteraceae bacterium]|jgi:predicted O-methyltransferase YrrM|nr:O-methyltransferase [Steroidobacteraceae bacterium]
MSQKTWTAVDGYLDDLIVRPDEALSAAQEASRAARLPDIAVSAPQGKLLNLLARSMGARRILEIGTLGGYSAIWLARALPPGGQLISLEYSPTHAEVARANLAHAGLAAVAEIRVGAGLELMPSLTGPFDFFFIDADKEGYPDYFRACLGLSRPGSMMVFDNAIREGEVIDARTHDPAVRGVRKLYEDIAAELRVSATAIQTVGVKGYDGFCMAVVNA